MQRLRYLWQCERPSPSRAHSYCVFLRAVLGTETLDFEESVEAARSILYTEVTTYYGHSQGAEDPGKTCSERLTD